ncbi:MAG: hypothetical protein DDT21_02762 [Syntrophomonadaceae bacterium]|nr:hypothetical protein [Bacillota bacterium]
MVMVYVLSKEGRPLMPTDRHGKVRHMLKSGKARVVKAKPFTVQLTYETTSYTQEVTLGVDAGYQHIGFSAVTGGEELISGEVHLLEDMSNRISDRAMYRRQRRSRLRYRRNKGLDNNKPEGWLAPSIQHKLDGHIKLVTWVKSLLPVTRVIIEVANFDIQAIKNPGISGKEYQQGEQSGHWNLREYILHRDNHQCQNPDCNNKAKAPILQVHHIGFWRDDYTDRPGNLNTLCDKCHRSENHKQGNLLWGWRPKVRPFRAETFMSTVRWKLVNTLECEHTYGYITKTRRIELKLEKSHANDAFVIAGGTTQTQCNPLEIVQVRRHNRSLQKFYDAKYIDVRTGEKASGQELNCGRRTRNRNLNGPNLRIYRGRKVSDGRVQIRKKRHPYQPGDTVTIDGKRCTVKGTQNHGAYVKLAELS